MITITIKRNPEKVKEVVFQGHAMYDDYGKDIVCAGVSSILTTTVNAILRLSKDTITFNDQKDFTLTVLKDDEITQGLLENMIELLEDLAKSYPKNITIRKRG